jgi:heme exporter protein A
LIGGQLARSARAEVGVVSHATYLYDELTAAENLWLYADLYGVPAPRARAAELLSTLGLAGESQTQVGRLSRGQQQRVAIARALVHDPPMLLLDEPDTGLDARAFDILEHLLVKSNRTVVLTTHNLALGLRMATRVAVLSHGLVVQDQPAASPQDAGRLLHLLADLARA